MSKFAALWLFCALVCGALLFKTSQAVTDGRAKLDLITADTRREEDSLRVLQAEWSYLNQPDRLEKLAAQYLKLAPMRGKQFAEAQSLPLRPVPQEALPENPAADAAAIAAIAAGIESSAGTPQTAVTTPAARPPRKPAELRQSASFKPAVKAAASAKPSAASAKPSGAPAKPAPVAAKSAAPKPAPAHDAAGSPRDFSDVLSRLGGTP